MLGPLSITNVMVGESTSGWWTRRRYLYATPNVLDDVSRTLWRTVASNRTRGSSWEHLTIETLVLPSCILTARWWHVARLERSHWLQITRLELEHGRVTVATSVDELPACSFTALLWLPTWSDDEWRLALEEVNETRLAVSSSGTHTHTQKIIFWDFILIQEKNILTPNTMEGIFLKECQSAM